MVFGIIPDIPEEGLCTPLKGFGFIKVFRTVDQNDNVRYYLMWEPDQSGVLALGRAQSKKAKSEHWNVEKLFRLIKQVCQVERFWVRTKNAVHTHLFSVLRAAQRLLIMTKHQIINSGNVIQKHSLFKLKKNLSPNMDSSLSNNKSVYSFCV